MTTTSACSLSVDLGYGGRAILRDPVPPPGADTVMMETTYGNRRHKQLQPSVEKLYAPSMTPSIAAETW